MCMSLNRVMEWARKRPAQSTLTLGNIHGGSDNEECLECMVSVTAAHA
jgi:hypothetical protein